MANGWFLDQMNEMFAPMNQQVQEAYQAYQIQAAKNRAFADRMFPGFSKAMEVTGKVAETPGMEFVAPVGMVAKPMKALTEAPIKELLARVQHYQQRGIPIFRSIFTRTNTPAKAALADLGPEALNPIVGSKIVRDTPRLSSVLDESAQNYLEGLLATTRESSRNVIGSHFPTSGGTNTGKQIGEIYPHIGIGRELKLPAIITYGGRGKFDPTDWLRTLFHEIGHGKMDDPTIMKTVANQLDISFNSPHWQPFRKFIRDLRAGVTQPFGNFGRGVEELIVDKAAQELLLSNINPKHFRYPMAKLDRFAGTHDQRLVELLGDPTFTESMEGLQYLLFGH